MKRPLKSKSRGHILFEYEIAVELSRWNLEIENWFLRFGYGSRIFNDATLRR